MNSSVSVSPKKLMVRMRDGVHLATSLYLPPGTGPFPAILNRTPYDRDRKAKGDATLQDPQGYSAAEVARFYVARGYAFVAQDIRGRYESEGTFEKYVSDGTDGYDVCGWLVAQDWSNGQICTIGHSYGAHTQTTLGALNPPGLVAQIIDSGGFWNAWKGGARHYGAFELKQIPWAMRSAQESPEAQRNPVMLAALQAEDLETWMSRLPWRRGHSPLRHHPLYEDYVMDQWEHGAFGPYWQQLGLWNEGRHAGYSDCAVVHISSYYDAYAASTVENFLGLRAAGKGSQRLVLGPWIHGKRNGRVIGDADFGPEAPLDSWAGHWLDYRCRFFDAVTKGAEPDEPTIRAFIAGGGTGGKTAEGHLDAGGRWIEASDWPVPDTVEVPFYLHAGGSLDTEAPRDDSASVSYDFDPASPVPSIGGNMTSLEALSPSGAYDQVEGPDFFACKAPYMPLASRPDVLVFQTEPLTRPIEILGHIKVRLWIETDGPDTDFTAKLIDVYPAHPDYPQGYAMILTDGIMRLRYAENATRERFRTPGEPVEIVVNMQPFGNRFEIGHRIRLDISSSNFPKFDVNTNTGEPEGRARRRRVAVNTVHASAGRSSHLVLPVLKAP